MLTNHEYATYRNCVEGIATPDARRAFMALTPAQRDAAVARLVEEREAAAAKAEAAAAEAHAFNVERFRAQHLMEDRARAKAEKLAAAKEKEFQAAQKARDGRYHAEWLAQKAYAAANPL
ncbi:hypothetical protein GGE65_004704 [Skermanella aerolata]|uniref:hypothetical protein n=1 Tax=Skermanella aerolata TaxID=393310 RepID=UPI003D23FC94